MGAVYDAVDESGAHVAAKVLTIKSTGEWTAWDLFERSSRVLMGLSHPGLPRVYAFAREEPARLILVREALDGGSLAERVKDDQRIPPTTLHQLTVALLEILAYLQSLVPPVIHRDIKPANIMFRAPNTWEPVLADFDTVAAPESQRTGLTVVGTIGYAAPEQLMGTATPASDVFGLGATLLNVITHAEPDTLPRQQGHLVLGPALSGVDAALLRVLQRMVEPDPAHRFPDARAALEALTAKPSHVAASRVPPQLSSSASTAGPAAPSGNLLQRLRLRHARTVTLVSAAIAMVGAGLLVAAWVAGLRPVSQGGHNSSAWFVKGAFPFALGLLLALQFRRHTRRSVERGAVQGNFSWRNLAGLDLSGLQLSQCVFDGSDMRGVDLGASRLIQCQLRGVDLRDARIDGATFIQCHFDGAQLDGASVAGATFTQCRPEAIVDPLVAQTLPSSPAGDTTPAASEADLAVPRLSGRPPVIVPLIGVVIAVLVAVFATVRAIVQNSGSPATQAVASREKACDDGNGNQCLRLGEKYETGDYQVSVDLAQAARLYQKACDRQTPRGCVTLGTLDKKKLGKGPAVAHELYLKACQQNDSWGCELVCEDLLHGDGVAADPTAAFDYCKRSCDAGSAGGCTTLGIMYADGAGVARDYFQAAALLSGNCNGGVARACMTLADLADAGHGVKQDHARAFSLRYFTCKHQAPLGCDAIAAAYRANATSTLEWLSTTCTNGDSFACGKIRELKTAP
jgi:TPR repeat protein